MQQNASAVQQSAAAAQAMRQHADTMVRAVSAFRLGDETRPAPRETSPSALPAAPPRKLALTAADDDWEQF